MRGSCLKAAAHLGRSAFENCCLGLRDRLVGGGFWCVFLYFSFSPFFFPFFPFSLTCSSSSFLWAGRRALHFSLCLFFLWAGGWAFLRFPFPDVFKLSQLSFFFCSSVFGVFFVFFPLWFFSALLLTYNVFSGFSRQWFFYSFRSHFLQHLAVASSCFFIHLSLPIPFYRSPFFLLFLSSTIPFPPTFTPMMNSGTAAGCLVNLRCCPGDFRGTEWCR